MPVPAKDYQTACKPGSVHLLRGWTAIPLERISRCVSRDQPERRDGNVPAVYPERNAPMTAAAPIRSCSRWGLPCRPCCQERGALLPHRFALARGTGPLAWTGLARAVCFLWHCPWGHPRRQLAGTAFPWSPDFPPRRGIAPSAAAVQLSGTADVRPCANGVKRCETWVVGGGGWRGRLLRK